jgi:hypothetical protein
VVAMAPVPDQVLADTRKSREVRIVSPASRLSPMQWLANAEDEARGEAQEIVDEAEEAVGSEAEAETEIGDTDPLQAAEDALRTFDADEIVVVVPPEEESSWLERASMAEGFERFERPVRYVAGV